MAYAKKKKGGWVYRGESTRADGSKKTYTGMTRRSPQKRASEHKKATQSSNNKTWTGKGTDFKLKSYFWSNNPRKAEKTMKKKRK
jgi:hypothetical protein